MSNSKNSINFANHLKFRHNRQWIGLDSLIAISLELKACVFVSLFVLQALILSSRTK